MQADMFHFGEKTPHRPAAPQALSKNEITVYRRPSIVIIEDEFLVAWDLQTMLNDLNFERCEIANDAESGVNLAINEETELLLVDVNLGGGPDGIEAVRRIKENRKVGVIFITAYTDEANLSRIRQVAPEAAVLSKPVSAELLLPTIDKLFPHT